MLQRSGYLAELEESIDPQDAGPGGEPAGAGQRRPGVHRARRGARPPRRTSGEPRRWPASWSRWRWSPTPTRSPADDPDAPGRGHADDAAHRQGPGVPGGLPHRPGGRRLPAPARRSATHASWRRSAGWPTSASPGPASGSTCPARSPARPWGAAAVQPAVAVPRRAAGRAGALGAHRGGVHLAGPARAAASAARGGGDRGARRRLRRRHAEGGRSSPSGSGSTAAAGHRQRAAAGAQGRGRRPGQPPALRPGPGAGRRGARARAPGPRSTSATR